MDDHTRPGPMDPGVERTVLRFLPLIRSVARRYAGRGADLDDLTAQSACEALDLILNCPDGRPVQLHLSSLLPGRVRDAAHRLRRQAAHGSVEALADQGYEPQDSAPAYTPQLLLAGVPIEPQEFLLVEDLLYGLTQKEIAQDLGCTQQNVSYMVRKLRDKLAIYLKDLL